ncbi:MAG: hypothetical protein KKH22_05825 [Proteobacteria bacterium]|nr:hypothetical protein [Pseudomonadota bacterium]
MQSNDSSKGLLRRLRVFGTIRKKTLAILAAIFFSAFLLLHSVSQYVLLQSFEELEIHTSKHCLAEVGKELASGLEVLDTLNRDWAWWDDAVSFVAKPTPEFIEINLSDVTFASAQVDLMGFFGPDGAPVFLMAYDRRIREKVRVAEEMLDFLKAHPELTIHANAESVRKGIIVFPQGPMLFVSRPILSSTRQGPVRGALVFGRVLDGAEIARIAQEEEIFLKVTPLDEARKIPPQLEFINTIQASGEKMAIFRNGAKSMTGAMLVDDLFGQPALLLEATLQRSIYERGQRAVSMMHWLFFGIGGVVCLVMMLLLDREIVRPVVTLSDWVARIGEDPDAESRVAIQGPAELQSLEGAINGMLDKVAHATLQATEKNAQLSREITERKELEQEREKLIVRLQDALAQVKTLKGFLPICASCKKIRDDSGYWKQIEAYIVAHADVTFSHGICPDCAQKLYGEYLDVEEALKKK